MLIDSKTVDVLQNCRFDVKIFYRLMERDSGDSSFGSRSTTSHQCSDQPAIHCFVIATLEALNQPVFGRGLHDKRF
jgi:hypothetical protein